MKRTVAAQFRISGVLKLRSRPGMFVCGEIVEGAVEAGMGLVWPIHGENIAELLRIHEVEHVDFWPAASGMALLVRFDEEPEENEDFLRQFLEVGMVVNILEASYDPHGKSG
jgi:hypothetical protein